MPQLGYPRIGWENENLASFLLSRFSFISRPHSVADDAGTDFFCTLFRRIIKTTNKKMEVLLPDNSFAIQIKSNKRKIPATKKIGYLSNLEIPYFIGVIDRQRTSLTLYSGAWIPHLFAYRGENIKLKLQVKDAKINEQNYHDKIEEREYLLKFPKVLEISAQEIPEDLNGKVEILSKLCSSIHENIASKKNKENFYNIPETENGTVTIAGKGSMQVFRNNFNKRLSEVFLNLKWSHENAIEQRLKDFIRIEYQLYEDLFLKMQDLYPSGKLPTHLSIRYQDEKSILITLNLTLQRNKKGVFIPHIIHGE